MTTEEFNERQWTAGMKAEYNGKVFKIGSVDFEEKLVAIYECGTDEELCWKRCENVEIVPTKTKKDISVGDKVKFISGNFAGLTGEIIKTDWESKEPRAIYGVWHEVKLSNGETGHIEKSEHWEYL